MIWLLLIIYQFKHLLADYFLQTPWMLGKFKQFPDYILPLAAHAGVHGLATFLIALVFKPEIAFQVGLMDMLAHFVIDRVKASPDLLGRFKALSANEMKNIFSYLPTLGKVEVLEKFKTELQGNRLFWIFLGTDQFCHHITHYIIIWLLVN